VVTDPWIEQYSGVDPFARISVAEVIDTLATRYADSVETAQFGRVADAGDAATTDPANRPAPMANFSEIGSSDRPWLPRMTFPREPDMRQIIPNDGTNATLRMQGDGNVMLAAERALLPATRCPRVPVVVETLHHTLGHGG
jgi:hypothetical protein